MKRSEVGFGRGLKVAQGDHDMLFSCNPSLAVNLPSDFFGSISKMDCRGASPPMGDDEPAN